MLVGTTHVDHEKIKKFIGNPSGIVTYVETLVPLWARHIPGIIDNQRYYVAIHVRKLISIPYKLRMELANALINNIRLHGMVSEFISIKEVIDQCNQQALCEMVKGKLKSDEEGDN